MSVLPVTAALADLNPAVGLDGPDDLAELHGYTMESRRWARLSPVSSNASRRWTAFCLVGIGLWVAAGVLPWVTRPGRRIGMG